MRLEPYIPSLGDRSQFKLLTPCTIFFLPRACITAETAAGEEKPASSKYSGLPRRSIQCTLLLLPFAAHAIFPRTRSSRAGCAPRGRHLPTLGDPAQPLPCRWQAYVRTFQMGSEQPPIIVVVVPQAWTGCTLVQAAVDGGGSSLKPRATGVLVLLLPCTCSAMSFPDWTARYCTRQSLHKMPFSVWHAIAASPLTPRQDG